MSVNVRLRVLMLLVIVAVASYAQSTWTFTPQQVAAGRTAFEQNCAACHGMNLRQLPESLLAGREFSAKWGSRGTNDLIRLMRTSMPPTNPGGLPEDTYAAIAAYILQFNGAAADGQALTARTTTRISDALAAGAASAPATGVATGASPVHTGVTVAGTVPN